MHRTYAWPLLALVASVIGVSAGGPGTTLIDAVKAGDRTTVRTLLNRAYGMAAEADGMTALHWAVRGGDAETARILIRARAGVNAANRYGITPLSLAAANGDAATARALLDAGAKAS